MSGSTDDLSQDTDPSLPATASTGAAAGPRGALAEELRFVSATETARRVNAGELSAVDAVGAALERIAEGDPLLNAFKDVRRELALSEAAEVDRRIAAGEQLALAGVPVAAKDEMPVAGEELTAGSFANTTVASEDAAIIRMIRAAGGVIVGTTRTPELCLTPFTESARGGITRNPWDLTRTPGGSSGGSVAAVASGMTPLATGGDGGGSIRIPAAWTGLPGLFAAGNVSVTPLKEAWHGLATYGGFARSIQDTALLYDVIGTPDWKLREVITEAPGKLRIAQSFDRAADRPIPNGGKVEMSWKRATDFTADALGELGHEVVTADVRFGAAAMKFSVQFLTIVREEAAATDHPERLQPGTKLLAKLGRVAAPLFGWAKNVTKERAAVERSLEGFDLLLTPAAPCSAPPVGENDGQNAVRVLLRAGQRVSYLNAWNLLGWPGLAIPAGLDNDGLPLSALLVGRPGTERLLLQVGAQLEAARPWQLGHAVP
jgi:amidase